MDHNNKIISMEHTTIYNPINNKINSEDSELIAIKNKVSENLYILENNQKCFIKFCPLLDHLNYLTGKYKNDDILIVPSKLYNNNNTIDKKINYYNNLAYIDSFFSYLASNLLNNYNFLNSIHYYGSCSGIKNMFHANITDDIETLLDSNYFYNNNNVDFKILNNISIHFSDSRKNKSPITVLNDNIELHVDELNEYNDFFYNKNEKANNLQFESIYEEQEEEEEEEEDTEEEDTEEEEEDTEEEEDEEDEDDEEDDEDDEDEEEEEEEEERRRRRRRRRDCMCYK